MLQCSLTDRVKDTILAFSLAQDLWDKAEVASGGSRHSFRSVAVYGSGIISTFSLLFLPCILGHTRHSLPAKANIVSEVCVRI